MSSNRFLGPQNNLSIRQPTDGSLTKGNIHNPPRYANLGMGGFNGASPRGFEASPFAVKAPGSTQRKEPTIDGENNSGT
ncbi:MAG TPA: hypothetical protein VMQ76_07825 [Terracidiphilus sp.]|jgi:hypothetical protein|nr:hypothetical protein [Terracidiphilus sp.]